jgi:hypothetical protein
LGPRLDVGEPEGQDKVATDQGLQQVRKRSERIRDDLRTHAREFHDLIEPQIQAGTRLINALNEDLSIAIGDEFWIAFIALTNMGMKALMKGQRSLNHMAKIQGSVGLERTEKKVLDAVVSMFTAPQDLLGPNTTWRDSSSSRILSVMEICTPRPGMRPDSTPYGLRDYARLLAIHSYSTGQGAAFAAGPWGSAKAFRRLAQMRRT